MPDFLSVQLWAYSSLPRGDDQWHDRYCHSSLIETQAHTRIKMSSLQDGFRGKSQTVFSMPLSGTRSTNTTEGGRESMREEEWPKRPGPRGSTSITFKKLSYLSCSLQTSFPHISNKERRTPLSDSVRSLSCTASVRAETWIRMCSVHSLVLAGGWTRQGSTKTRLSERGNTGFIQKASLIWALFFFLRSMEVYFLLHENFPREEFRLLIRWQTDYCSLFWFSQNWGKMWETCISVCSEHMPYTKMFYHYDLVQLH